MRAARLLLLASLLAAPAAAAERLIAFGDSMTEGVGDSASPPGYPPKLKQILGDAGLDVTIDNLGLGGETTFEGLSRIDGALDGGGAYLLLMEGTNDITLAADGEVSIESVAANLDTMATKARSRGIQPIVGTVLPRPPKARKDKDNTLTRELNWQLYELTARTVRPFADLWARFNRFVYPDVLRTLYSDMADDPVGHPNNAGYQVIAELFADQILGTDTLPPVPGRFAPFTTTLAGPTEFTASLFESAAGAGIKLKHSHFEVNGEAVAKPTRSASNKRQAHFRYSSNLNRLGCRVVLGFRGRDQADPPNELAQLIWAYGIEGREHVPADIDGNCVVDRPDLEQFARGFGAEAGDPRFSLLLDLNSDDVIDGLDFAIFASKFGVSTR